MPDPAHPDRPRGPFRLSHGDVTRDLDSEAAVNGALMALPRGKSFNLIDLSCNREVSVDALGNLQYRSPSVAFGTQDLQKLIGNVPAQPMSVVSSAAITIAASPKPSSTRASSSARHSDQHVVRHRPRMHRGRSASYATMFFAVGIVAAIGVGIVLMNGSDRASPTSATVGTKEQAPVPIAPPPLSGTPPTDDAPRVERVISSLSRPAASDTASAPAPTPAQASLSAPPAKAPETVTASTPRSMSLWLMLTPADPGTQVAFHQPIRVRAEQPFTVRVERRGTISAVRFSLTQQGVANQYLERQPPYLLWGDLQKATNMKALSAGTYPLTIMTFANYDLKQQVETYETTLLVE